MKLDGYSLRDAKDLGRLSGRDQGHSFARQRWFRLPRGRTDTARHWVIACKRCARGVELVPRRQSGHLRWFPIGPAIQHRCDARNADHTSRRQEVHA